MKPYVLYSEQLALSRSKGRFLQVDQDPKSEPFAASGANSHVQGVAMVMDLWMQWCCNLEVAKA